MLRIIGDKLLKYISLYNLAVEIFQYSRQILKIRLRQLPIYEQDNAANQAKALDIEHSTQLIDHAL